ncbi:Bug family tripartite tricarboxylate transporter substrate binding protein [Hydrogenophaga sp. BPS33]|uniref:Bug family tripartite tricarboxylate transporter substrate binding protein n=1 Tax=Hydrogenophaga sp. BPS33 TaxID=2651974 RepID=UPI001F3DA244|nr:tripartite tricarboxylate transporter substrate binding protein [Hydrogenophaga sp. BPS33]
MTPMKTRHAVWLCAAALFTLGGAHAQDAASYPNKPIRLVVPFTPGGSSDILARSLSQKLGESLRQPVVIENVPGAGGSVGAEKVAKSAPDGYTLLMGHIGTHAVNPLIQPKIPYDPIKDFAPVAWVANVPNVLIVNSALPVRNLKELVAYARSKPGELNYGTGGNGSAAHLATEYLKMVTKTFMVHVPYRGAAPAINDLIANQTQVGFPGAPVANPFIKGGQVRAIAVSSTQRLDVLPDVPTVAESGYPDFEADQWYGVMAPAGTPPEIVRKLNQQINQALQSPDVRQRLQGEGAVPMNTTPEAFGSHIAKALQRWRPVVKAGNMTAN